MATCRRMKAKERDPDARTGTWDTAAFYSGGEVRVGLGVRGS